MTVLQQEIGINDLINILAGFKITKSFDKCLETWEKVVPVVVGDILWKNEARAGQCCTGVYGLSIGFFKSFIDWWPG